MANVYGLPRPSRGASRGLGLAIGRLQTRERRVDLARFSQASRCRRAASEIVEAELRMEAGVSVAGLVIRARKKSANDKSFAPPT